MEKAADRGAANAEAQYDRAVIRLAAGDPAAALEALEKALSLNPKLRIQAKGDNDLSGLRGNAGFVKLIKE
jgi:tetratricopeptide (TPR) repeat protein